MPGLRITIPTTFTDTTLPVLREDPILPVSGALMLIDPAHPLSGDIALTSPTVIPNIAADRAAALLGTTDNLVNAQMTISGISTTPNATGVVEKSSKGGIHTILTASAITDPTGLVIRPDQAIVDYVVAHPNNDYYFSVWYRPTRLISGSAPALIGISLSTTPSSSQLLASMTISGGFVPSSGNRIGALRSPTTVVITDPEFSNGAVSAYTGTPTRTGSSARDYFSLWKIGTALPFNTLTNGPVSGILYRSYIEDLTVSGRTYAEVSALDQALYSTEVLTAGGRYYGDTFTNPTTIP